MPLTTLTAWDSEESYQKYRSAQTPYSEMRVLEDVAEAPHERERTKVLADDVEQRIREAAEECGFDDPSYFVKYFRRYVGETPGAYRERIARKFH